MRFTHQFAKKAFSLVELILAIGITVIVLSILLAFLTLGVQTVADSQSESIGSLVAENIRAELISNTNDLRDISSTSPALMEFDSAGERILPGSDNGDLRYVARLRLHPPNPTLTSSDNARYRYWQWEPRDGNVNNAHTQRLFIEIFRAPAFEQDGSPFTSFSLVRALPPAR